MYPILVDFGEISLFGFEFHARIGTYGAIFVGALLVGWWLCVRLGRQLDPKVPWTDLYFGSIIAGVIGAKVLHALILLPEIMSGRYSFWGVIVGGGVWLGGALAGFGYNLYCARQMKVDVGSVMNVFFTVIPLAHGIGRLACLMGGCCYGASCDLPWAITYTNPLAEELMQTPLHDPRHPTPIYEFLLEMGNFAVCYALWTRRAAPWRILAAWSFLYGVERFFLEFVRADFRGSLGPFSTSQWIALAMVVAGAMIWAQTSGSKRMQMARST